MKAISVETVDVAAWRADHAVGDAPLLPSADLTPSMMRHQVPEGLPVETFGGSEWALRPEHPHWPLVGRCSLPRRPSGAQLHRPGGAGRLWPPGWRAWRARRCSISDGRSSPGSAAQPAAFLAVARGGPVRHLRCPGGGGGGDSRRAPVAAAFVGAAGVYASGRLYMVPGRPAWCRLLTLAGSPRPPWPFGRLMTGHGAVGVVGVAGGLSRPAPTSPGSPAATGSSGGAPPARPPRFRNLSPSAQSFRSVGSPCV